MTRMDSPRNLLVMFPELTSARFLLQQIVRDDQAFVFEGLSHPQVIPFYGVWYDSFEDTGSQMDFYDDQWKEGTGCYWKIVDRETGERVGVIGFNKMWKTFLIICSAAPLAVLGNTARLTTIILVGKIGGHDAGTMIEQKFGFVTFTVALIGLLILGYLIRDRKPSTRPTGKPHSVSGAPVQEVPS